MTVRSPHFTSADHAALDTYLLKLMQAVRSGSVEPTAAAADLAQVLCAVDIGNYAEPLARASSPERFIARMGQHR